MQETVLDDFADLSGWTAITSGQSKLTISQNQGPHGNAMRLDFDFRGGGGFVGVRKLLPLQLPESYKFGFNIRGNAPSNIFGIQACRFLGSECLALPGGGLRFPADWQPLHIRNSQIEFAWGPLGGGPASSIDRHRAGHCRRPGRQRHGLDRRSCFQDLTYRALPVGRRLQARCRAMSRRTRWTGSTSIGWRSAAADEPQWLLIDFQQEREYGGLVIDWEEGLQPLQFDVQLSLDGADWKPPMPQARQAPTAAMCTSPGAFSRYIKLGLYQSVEKEGFGITQYRVKPYEASRSLNHFFPVHRPGRAAWGSTPNILWAARPTGRSSAPANGDGQALFNEEGMVEVDAGTFSIEPFLYVENRLITWADVMLNQDLVNRICRPCPLRVAHGRPCHEDHRLFASARPAGPFCI